MTEKGWLGPYAPADRHADDKTIDHIIELRKKLAEAERQRDNALNMLVHYHRMWREKNVPDKG
jgi:hypothetical protein